MKKDFVFIILVIAIGVSAAIYTRNSEDDVLFERREGVVGSGAEPVEQYDINYKRTRKGGTSNYDRATQPVDSLTNFRPSYKPTTVADNNNEEIDQVFDEIEQADTIDQPKISNQAEDVPRWIELFDQWKILFADNVTVRSNIVDASSPSECSISFETNDQESYFVEIVANMDVAVKSKDLLVYGEQGKVALKNIKNPGSVRSGLHTLKRYCKNLK
jgi:hypothetical protein